MAASSTLNYEIVAKAITLAARLEMDEVDAVALRERGRFDALTPADVGVVARIFDRALAVLRAGMVPR